MAVKVKILSDRRNLNNMRVTAGFINAIVSDHQRYIGTPLVVDKLRLEAGQYSRLTHLQDERTGAFGSQQIGSFVAFEVMQEADGENVLVGTARIEKRFDRACAAIQQLYEMDRLRVSFEITAATYTQTAEEIIIDAADGNQLIGMCIVSIPAYEDAKALALVASLLEEHEVPLIPEISPMNERNDVMAETKKTPAAETPEEQDTEKDSPVPEEEKESKKPDTKKAELTDPVIDALMVKIENLEQTNAQLSVFKDKWEAAEAAVRQAEEDKKRTALCQLITDHKLKVEDYQDAIAKLDYATIVCAINEINAKKAVEKSVVPVIASANGLVQEDGIKMVGNKADHPYHKLVKDLTL